MRLYVLCYSDYEGIAPHIIAEVVRESVRDDPAMSLASALAGERSLIVTRTELLSDPLGRRALEAWEDKEDSMYRSESEAILTEEAGESAASLRLVSSDRRVSGRAERDSASFLAIGARAAARRVAEGDVPGKVPSPQRAGYPKTKGHSG